VALESSTSEYLSVPVSICALLGKCYAPPIASGPKQEAKLANPA